MDREQYLAALAEISTLMDDDPDPTTPAGIRLDQLVTDTVAYEAIHYPMAPAIYSCDPTEIPTYTPDQVAGLQQAMIETYPPHDRADSVCAFCEDTGICVDTEGKQWPCPQQCERKFPPAVTWSCNPADVPEWTLEAKKRLIVALGEVFNWKPEDVDAKLKEMDK